MKNRFSFCFLIALFIGVMIVPAFSLETDGDYVVVDVEAEAADRLSAINSALSDAVRIAAGSFIDSKTELDNDELRERIISYSRGSVAKYEVTHQDATRASEGIYKIGLKVWVEAELIRDGIKTATNQTAVVAFDPSKFDAPERPAVDASAEKTDSAEQLAAKNAESGLNLLEALFERYSPEEFFTYKAVGGVTKVKDHDELGQVLVEVSFNMDYYTQKFIPDLVKILDTIALEKEDVTLSKQRETLRKLVDGKGAPLSDTSVILTALAQGKKGKNYSLAVYDRPDIFRCRLYSFSKENADKILNNKTGILAKFRSRIATIKGFEMALKDENGDEIFLSDPQNITVPFLLTDSVVRDNIWAVHPTLMSYAGMYKFVPIYMENTKVTIPLRFELLDEIKQQTRQIEARLVTEDEFADSWLTTRHGLHATAIDQLTKGMKIAQNEFEEANEAEYPLAQAALDSIEANNINAQWGELLLEEVIDRLEEGRNRNNIAAIYATFLRLEADAGNFESQKASVPYLTQAAMVHPEAMIRMGEVQEQGFYGVKPNKKKADFYYKEGTRILTQLAAQGLPVATVALGHVYLEGLGTKQDTRKAERYYEFAKKSGYYDHEYWFWEHFHVALRQVAMPEIMIQNLKNCNYNGYLNETVENSAANPRTCLYAIREKTNVVVENNCGIGCVNIPVFNFIIHYQQDPEEKDYLRIFSRTWRDYRRNYAHDFSLWFITLLKNGERYNWSNPDKTRFKFIPDKDTK